MEKYTDKEIVEKLLSNDSQFVPHFFYKMCYPLLSKIAWSVFDNQVDVTELSNELLLLLKSNNWARLRSFQYQSSLFTWLKVVAIHHFQTNKQRFIPALLPPTPGAIKYELYLDDATPDDLSELLKLVSIKSYHDILYMVFVDKFDDEKICSLMCLDNAAYKRKKSFAIEHLKSSIMNSDSYFISLYIKEICPDGGSAVPEGFTQPSNWNLTLMDIESLIKSIPNDRYRYILDSLIIKERSRQIVAQDLGVSIANLDNIKSRALKQLAEIARKEGEYGKL